jgi:hypothetical protein
MFDDTAVDPVHVTSAILKAIESKHPAARYVRPWRTYVMLWMKWLLPTSWVDAMMARMTGLTKKKLLAGSNAVPAHP